ncbi:MAG: TetR/AcrR family transcriptional regulator [Alphaproteobacteria bacterium]|nr:TetR/AcrR family transcriptional regulator [Alphaproteobacteria bacterium]
MRTELYSVAKLPGGADEATGPGTNGSSRLAARREKIVAALRQGMLTKGYAETSLTDLAKRAGMSVSHLLYYYASKDAVLVELCEQFVKRAYADVAKDKDKPPADRIRIIAGNLFVRGAIVRSEFSILRELNALSAHRPEIHKWLRSYGEWVVDYLTDLFEKVPRQPGLGAADAAEIAAALWMGLVNNAEFDATLSDSRAERLFSRTLFSLAGIEPPARARARTAPSRIRVSVRRN